MDNFFCWISVSDQECFSSTDSWSLKDIKSISLWKCNFHAKSCLRTWIRVFLVIVISWEFFFFLAFCDLFRLKLTSALHLNLQMQFHIPPKKMFKNLKLSKVLDPCSTFIIVFEKKWNLYIFSKSHNLNLTFLLFYPGSVTKHRETSPAITPYHTYHFSISTSLTFITSKLPSQDDFHHLITFTTR